MIIGGTVFVYFVIMLAFILQTWVPRFSPLGGGLLDDSYENRKLELSGDFVYVLFMKINTKMDHQGQKLRR